MNVFMISFVAMLHAGIVTGKLDIMRSWVVILAFLLGCLANFVDNKKVDLEIKKIRDAREARRVL